MWDESKLLVMEILKQGYSISIKCSTINRKIRWISNIYGPTHYRDTNLAGVVSSFRPLYWSLVFGRGFQHHSKGTREISSRKINKGNEKI